MDWPQPKKEAWLSKSSLGKFASHHLVSRLIEYTHNSSVHGLRYIGDITLHPLERLFWLVAFLLALAASSFFISNLIIKFDVMPVITSLSPQSSSIKDIPFPSITICNMNSMRQTEANRILNSKVGLPSDSSMIFPAFSSGTSIIHEINSDVPSRLERIPPSQNGRSVQICLSDWNAFHEFKQAEQHITTLRSFRLEFVPRVGTYIPTSGQCEFEEADVDQKLIYDFCDTTNITQQPTDQNLTADWEYIKKFMVKMTQPCHEMLTLCKWHGDPLSCSDLFNPSLTDEGMCCVFNRLNRELIFQNPRDLSDINVTFPFEAVDWSPERGYPENTNPDNLPRRPRGSGTHLGLTVVVDAELSEYFCSTENGKGFKVLLSNPIETPKVSSFGVSIPPGQETKMVIIPHIMTATPELANIDMSKRLCFFENERELAFYRTYAQKSCVLECEANFTLALCGCVQYYMPKNKQTRICGRTDRGCAIDAQKKMELSMNEAITNLTFTTNKTLSLCKCLPGCHELSYGFVISSVPITDHLIVKPNFQGDKDYKYFKENMAIIHFYFMEKQFSGTVRGVLFGVTELLSNAGGLLGLFMGFSFLSAVELLYFLTLRVWFHLNKRKNAQEPSENNLNQSNIGGISTLFTKSYFPFNE